MDSGSADTKQESRRQKCIGTGQPAWFCRLCDVAAQSFDNFTTHLEGQKHALNEYGMVQRDLTALPENATNMVKKQPEKNFQKRNLVAGPSEKEASLDQKSLQKQNLVAGPSEKEASLDQKNFPKRNLVNLFAGTSQKEASLDPQPKNATNMLKKQRKINLQKRNLVNLVAATSQKEASLYPQPKNATNMLKKIRKKNLQKRKLVARTSCHRRFQPLPRSIHRQGRRILSLI